MKSNEFHAQTAPASSLLVTAVPALLLIGSFAFLYRSVIVKLVHDWATDENYSHGFLIVPLALYLIWERRHALRQLARRPQMWGLLIVLAAVGLLAMGSLGAELFVARVSMIGVIAGAIVFLFGWGHLRVLAFPVAFLLLMIPLPVLIFNQIAFPLQLLASRAGEAVLVLAGIPVLREGNLIVLAHTTLEVAEACSGIRSLISLLTLGIVYGYFSDPRTSVRVIIALSTVPIAIIANGLRVAGTGIAAQFYGPAAAEGFFHSFTGWVMFVIAFGAIFVVRQLTTSVLRMMHRAWPEQAVIS